MRRVGFGISVTLVALVTSGGAAFGALIVGPWTQRVPEIAPVVATARVLLTMPGPPGRRMDLLMADSTVGGKCWTVALQGASDPDFPAAGECNSGPRSAPSLLMDSTYTVKGPVGTSLLHAPGAAYEILSDGATTLRRPVVDGISAVYFGPDFIGRPLTLTSFSGSGTRVAEVAITFPRDEFSTQLPPMAPPADRGVVVPFGTYQAPVD